MTRDLIDTILFTILSGGVVALLLALQWPLDSPCVACPSVGSARALWMTGRPYNGAMAMGYYTTAINGL